MNVDDDRITDSSPDCDKNGEANGSTEMAGVLLSLESSLKQLVQASKAQTTAFTNLREDILSQPDPNEEDKAVVTDGTPNLLDLTTATNQLLNASGGHSPKSLPNNSYPDEGTNNDFLDSLIQALLPNSKKSPDIEEKIATLLNNILTGELSQDSVKQPIRKLSYFGCCTLTHKLQVQLYTLYYIVFYSFFFFFSLILLE